jgi:hypothetical protein
MKNYLNNKKKNYYYYLNNLQWFQSVSAWYLSERMGDADAIVIIQLQLRH